MNVTPKPSNPNITLTNKVVILTPSAMPKISEPKKKSSPPVTNPAFREHEGLRNLQRQLHVDANKTK